MIRVVVLITTKPGRRDELLAAFQANAPAVRREKGCIEYAAFVDAAGAARRTWLLTARKPRT
ncbi:MAG TPA: antibiotic biosynthesis monooxygenase [Roseiarcus sp.]|nr:antibiotic biosynthesis monooxygenase [Roseiarcus sp.]